LAQKLLLTTEDVGPRAWTVLGRHLAARLAARRASRLLRRRLDLARGFGRRMGVPGGRTRRQL